MATQAQTGTEAPAGGAGGLPQFDPTWWGGEIVWFCVIFVVVLTLMAKVFVPRVGGTITAREDHIAGNIDRARALKEQAEAQAAADVKSAAAELATELAAAILTHRTRAMTSDPAVDKAVAELSAKLQ